jgi:polygalacturonase
VEIHSQSAFYKTFIVAFVMVCFAGQWASCRNFEVTKISNQSPENTRFIQSKIDSCSLSGGGKVILPRGKLVCGTLVLKNGVRLFLPKNCILIGDTNPDLFPDMAPKTAWYKGKENHHNRALIYAEGQKNIGLEGKGIIDGQGSLVYSKFVKGKIPFRWMNILFTQCEKVRISGLTLTNSPSWMQFYQGCRDLKIREIKVINFGSKNNDGLDLEACQNVLIEKSIIHSDDDALVLKSLSPGKMKGIRICNCLLSSNCNALKTGTESENEISDIRISDLVISRPVQASPIYKRKTGLAGIALTMVDGGRLKNVSFRNIQLSGYKVPIFIRQGKRNRTHLAAEEQGRKSKISHISFKNLNISYLSDFPIHFTAVDSVGIVEISFSKTEICMAPEDSLLLGENRLPFEEKPKAYPEATMFGNRLPRALFFLKYVSHISGLGKVKFCPMHEGQNRSILISESK